MGEGENEGECEGTGKGENDGECEATGRGTSKNEGEVEGESLSGSCTPCECCIACSSPYRSSRRPPPSQGVPGFDRR